MARISCVRDAHVARTYSMNPSRHRSSRAFPPHFDPVATPFVPSVSPALFWGKQSKDADSPGSMLRAGTQRTCALGCLAFHKPSGCPARVLRLFPARSTRGKRSGRTVVCRLRWTRSGPHDSWRVMEAVPANVTYLLPAIFSTTHEKPAGRAHSQRGYIKPSTTPDPMADCAAACRWRRRSRWPAPAPPVACRARRRRPSRRRSR